MSIGNSVEVLQYLASEPLVHLKSVWNYTLFISDNSPIKVSNIAISLTSLFMGLLVVRYITLKINNKLLSKLHIEPDKRLILHRILHYLLIFLVTLIVLDIASIPLKSLAVIGGALALGVGFGTQNIFNNFISGLIIIVEKPVKIGDLVEINGVYGKVVNIGTRCICIRNGSNGDILVPNSTMLQNNITNWTLENDQVKLEIKVPVAYGMPAKQIKTILLEAVKNNPAVIKYPEPEVLLASIADRALNFSIQFWINLAESDKSRIKSDINFTIVELFNQNNIELADIHREVVKSSDD